MKTVFESWPELLKVERPGRYLGGEMEAVPNTLPDEKGRLLTIALAFPDVYEIAHGHLGHKILYEMINQRPGLSAERAYAPWPDWEAVLVKRGERLKSLESRKALADFDLLGFSLQYELGFTNILNMLHLSGIPLKASQRDEEYPLIVAGGPVAYNPEPLADFFDIFFLGDAEVNFIDDLEIIKAWKAEKAPKEELYQRLAGRPGIYIPSLFKAHYDQNGRFLKIEALKSTYDKVIRSVAPSLQLAPFPLCQITPLIKPVHDRIVIEIGRGCSRGCRFCQAGYIYRPVRERSEDKILELAQKNLKQSGHDEASFLSLSAGDHSQISTLLSSFMDEYAAQSVALSLPSLRVKSLSSQLAEQIKRVRKTGFTIAPEAGSQRLRNVINKDLTDDDLMSAAEDAFSLGWRTLKLYFMVGLPSETEEDIEAIAQLGKKVKKMARCQINLAVAHFTPKAHTPFQWHEASSVDTINKRLWLVRDLAKNPGLKPKWNAAGASWVESILARGDRRLGAVLEKVFKAGARFEAWGDRFDPSLWREALASENLDEEFLLKPFDVGDPLPYGHIFAGVNEDFLKRELDKSKKAEVTADCRWDKCLNCGACHDGAKIDLALATGQLAEESSEINEDTKTSLLDSQNKSSLTQETAPQTIQDQKRDEKAISLPTQGEGESKTLRHNAPSRQSNINIKGRFLINFSLEGPTAFLGHLETVELFKRSFKRAGIELSHSQGFHPQPKLSFLTALPLGVASNDEYLSVSTCHVLSASEIAEKLSAELPLGIVVKQVRALKAKEKIKASAIEWDIDYGSEVFKNKSPLHPDADLSYTTKKGCDKTYKLSDFVEMAESHGDRALVRIKIGLNGTPKPVPTVEALWGLESGIKSPLIKKTKTVLA